MTLGELTQQKAALRQIKGGVSGLHDEDFGHIYGLFDPNTGYLKYIGQTVTHPFLRLIGHMGEVNYNRPVNRWVRSLHDQGLVPDIRTLLKVRKPRKHNKYRKHPKFQRRFNRLENTFIGIALQLDFPITNGPLPHKPLGLKRCEMRKIQAILESLPGRGKSGSTWRREAVAAGWSPPEWEVPLAA